MDKFVSQTETSLKKKKRRWTPKGRQVEDKYLDEVSKLFSGLIFKRDELIEYLHILQDKFGVLYDKHLVALSTIINLPLSEIYEVATFYAHFNIVKDSKDYNPVNVVRVCESLTCELFGAHKLLQDIKKLENKNIKVILHFAGQSSGEKSFYDPVNDFNRNLLSTVKLLDFYTKN